MAKGAEKIMIVGKSGTGKSRSIKDLPPKETFLFNIVGKDLPFKGSNKIYKELVGKDVIGNMLISRDADKISRYMIKLSESRPELKYIVLDDFQYLMSLIYVTRIREMGYDKFQDILSSVWTIMVACDEIRSDIKVFFTIHSTDDSEYQRSAKTAGKAVNKYITLEGLFSIVLWTRVIIEGEKEGVGSYYFETQNDGTNTAKSPEEMFDFLIPNSLYYVSEKIDDYNQ